MPVPTSASVKAEIKDIRCFDQFVRQSRPIDGTENQSGLAELSVNVLSPPATRLLTVALSSFEEERE
jgi:hypothetical protein